MRYTLTGCTAGIQQIDLASRCTYHGSLNRKSLLGFKNLHLKQRSRYSKKVNILKLKNSHKGY